MIGSTDARHLDARHCAAIVAEHARTFHTASRLLPAEKRRAAFALYAFCRLADDIVDGDAGAGALASRGDRLAAYVHALDAALAGRATTAVFRELHRTVTRYAVPARTLRELLAGVANDLRPITYATWAELSTYCEGVASSVGEMCVHVFGVTGDADVRERAVHHARTLGVAMQLTNVLRDVGEDARRGRCYLPSDELAAFGLTADDVLQRTDLARDARWQPFMAFQIARARALYAAARPGLSLLAPDAVPCAAACATGYAGILDAIVANGYDTIATRARLGRRARLAVLWRAWRGGAIVDTDPRPTWNGTADGDEPELARLA